MESWLLPVNLLSNLDERVWAEIDLAALEYNTARIKESLGDVKQMAVIKANAYGHGAVEVAQRLEKCGVDYLAVACLSEALELRENGICTPILIMGYTPVAHAGLLTRYGITQAIFDIDYARALSDAANAPITVHIKVDTGMNRLGVVSTEEVCEISQMRNLKPEGIYTHLAAADMPNDGFVGEQVEAFRKILSKLVDIKFEITHCANSGGMLYYKSTWFNMVRTGLVNFGAAGHPDYKPVMKLKARIAQVKDIQAGQTVSYGRTFTAEQNMKIAVVCAGYADGYMRSLSSKGFADYDGVLVPVIGRICMDMLMIDVSEIRGAKAGDAVTLFGSENLSTATVAGLAGTIPYEMLCSVGGRVPRKYFD